MLQSFCQLLSIRSRNFSILVTTRVTEGNIRTSMPMIVTKIIMVWNAQLWPFQYVAFEGLGVPLRSLFTASETCTVEMGG